MLSADNSVCHGQNTDGTKVTPPVEREISERMLFDVFQIRCKTTIAELFRNKLGSGGRGRCVKYKDQWYTPSEFEHLCGRGSSKDWKRSIKYGGRSLQSLIDDGVLTPHATNCCCCICSDDVSGSGPVRLFTPYKRRKRNKVDEEYEDGKKQSSISETSDICPYPKSTSVNSVPFVNASTNHGTPNSVGLAYNQQVLKNLEIVYSTMIKAANDFKRIIVEMQNSYSKTLESLVREKNVPQSNIKTNSSGIDESVSGTILNNELLSTKVCANCNREALAECSLCRVTPYCSTFCQRKDWNSHQVECGRHPCETAEQIMLLVDNQT